MGSHKGYWSYAINKLPNTCKEVLESGNKLPKDYKSKLYPKNRPAFPKKPFYEIIRECSKRLAETPSLISAYNVSLDQIATTASQKTKKEQEQKTAQKLAKEQEGKHPDFSRYKEWQTTLNKLSKSSAFEFVCKEENQYNQQLFSICLKSEHRSLNLIKASLDNLWRSKNRRNNMNEIINILDSDFKDSMKVVNGKPIPDMVLTKIRFRNSLEKYFKTKGFSVYDAIAVLN